MRNVALLIALLCASALGKVGVSDPFPNLRLNLPVDLTNDGTSTRLYVVEQPGRIVVWNGADPTVSQATVFLDIQDRVDSGGEKGLLGLAFHPNYAANNYFYVYYTNPNSVVSRFTATGPLTANPGSELVLMTFTQPYANHNGGALKFWGPYLYIGSGDGGSGGDPQGYGQNTQTMLGKILRIDVDNPSGGKQYGIPADNPFVGNAAFYPEIFAYGLRNPWRISFDTVTGKLFTGDVGQGAWEEVSIVPRGGNMGWKVMEGTHCYSPQTGCNTAGKVLPIHEYPHANGDASITGGFVFRGKNATELEGKYVFADYASGRVWSLTFNEQNPAANTVELLSVEGTWRISSFGVNVDQSLFFVDLASGKVFGISSDGEFHNNPNSAPTLRGTACLVLSVLLMYLM